MNITHDITFEEKERIYREKEREYTTEDAKRHLLEEFNFDEENEGDLFCPDFELKTGFSLGEAVDPESPNYVLDDLVEAYFDTRDCNISENDTWACVIKEMLNH